MRMKTHVCNWMNDAGGGLCGARLYEGEEHRHPSIFLVTVAEYRKLHPPLRPGRPKRVKERPFVLKRLWPVGTHGITFMAESKTGELWKGYFHVITSRMIWTKVQEATG